ncbi:MAG: hypothetical protein Q8M11_19295 [Sulfuritalea sp.]|nr:hypothetical protein [Sulfuritalea sp.]MDP1983329.1 hypothetical protein [Sulfuritalea sp.]
MSAATNATAKAGNKVKIMAKQEGVPVFRVIAIVVVAAVIYGGSAVVADANLRKSAAACLANLESRTLEFPPALSRAKSMIYCLERREGWVAAWRLHRLREALRALPNAPAEFAGEWVSSQPNCSYRVLFRREGTFKATPISCPAFGDSFEGAWGVAGNSMVWMYQVNGRVWPPDVNAMDAGPAGTFHLQEENGSRTVFRRMEADQLSVEGILEAAGPSGTAAVTATNVTPRRDGVYVSDPASQGASACTYLRFNANETVTMISGACAPGIPDAVQALLVQTAGAAGHHEHLVVPVVVQGNQIRFTVEADGGGASYRGLVVADGLRLNRRSQRGGDMADRAYRFVEWKPTGLTEAQASGSSAGSTVDEKLGGQPKTGDKQGDDKYPK